MTGSVMLHVCHSQPLFSARIKLFAALQENGIFVCPSHYDHVICPNEKEKPNLAMLRERTLAKHLERFTCS